MKFDSTARVAKEISALDESARFRRVMAALDDDWRFGLSLVPRCALTRSQLEELLVLGLDRGDRSTIRFWLEALIPPMGFTRAANVLRRELGTRTNGEIDKVMYWLPRYAPVDQPRAARALRALFQLVEERGAMREPRNRIAHSDGSVSYSAIDD